MTTALLLFRYVLLAAFLAAGVALVIAARTGRE